MSATGATQSAEISARWSRRARGAGALGLLAAVLVLVWAAWCTHLLLSARTHLTSARRNLQELSGSKGLKAVLDGQRRALNDAQNDLSKASDDLSSPWLSLAKPLPIAGTQIRAARAMTQSADRIVRVVVTTSEQLAPSQRASISRLELFNRVASGGKNLADALDRADLGPTSGLIGSLSQARSSFAAQIASVRDPLMRANAALPGLQRLLTGPSHILLLAANNAEMASGSGRPLAVAVADIVNGEISVGDFAWSGSVRVPAGSVPLPDDLARWAPLDPQTAIFRAMVSPRFDVTAPLMAAEYQSSTGKSVDGVMIVDVVALQKFVAASPSTASTTDPNALSADRLIEELMNGQYLNVDYAKAGDNEARQERMGAVARAVITDLISRHDDHVQVARVMMEAIAGHHILFWSARPDLELASVTAGSDGRLSENSLAVTLQNVGDNKLDWFARVRSDLSITTAANGEKLASLTVIIDCDVPDGQPRYVAGPGLPNLPYGDYLGYLTLHAPSGATNLRRADGVAPVVSGRDGPATIIGQQVSVKRNVSMSTTFLFSLPATIESVKVESSARYPAVGWTFGQKTWFDTRVETLNLVKGN